MFKKIIGLGFSAKGKNAKDVQEYIKTLVESGAGEFFTGYTPKYWYEKFGFEVSPNGRFSEHEQITDFDTLTQVVDAVHSYGIEIFGNLNSRYYTDETMPYIEKMYEEFLQAGLDGIICGNIGILEFLKQKKYTGKINISTILAIYNDEAIKFLIENYKINKIILSRELTLKEIEHIVQQFPDMRFEVFGEGDFCRYNNGLCFAEHKYTTRDICTVVVNDLIIKKRYHPDFKKIILDETLSNIEKLEKLSDTFENIFEEIESLLEKNLLGLVNEIEVFERLKKIYTQSLKREDIFFDAGQVMSSVHNKNIISYLKGLKLLLTYTLLSGQERKNYENLSQEVEQSIQSGIRYLHTQLKSVGQEPFQAQNLKNFYAKGDSLNLYSYLFFSKFKNIDTVKFPTRGRDYAQKIALIEQVLQLGEVPKECIHRGISPERAHYDMSYLFGEKLWFRDLMKSIEYG